MNTLPQATTSVERILDNTPLLLAIEMRLNQDPTWFNENDYLAALLKNRISNGEYLSDVDRLNLANYILDYFVDYKIIAQHAFDALSKCNKPNQLEA